MSQYIGKTISLVSVTDNRYVGLLEEIDSEKGTVTLQNVRCFGTEGRKNWGPEEIYPNPTVYKSVKFNGNEVKDLSILDVKLEEVQPVLPPQGVMQPASAMPGTGERFQQQPQQQQQQQQQQPQQPQPQTQVPAAVAGYGVYAPEPTPGEPTATAVSTGQRAHATPQQPRAAAEGQRRQSAQNRKVEIPQEDFDFQSNNAKFVKDENETPGSEPSNNEPVASAESHPEQFYNKKSSFFDSISTSTDTGSNMRWQEEKAMNMDTFGQASARPRFGRGGRGRGRGGRGRGNRGRGNRGGFQNRNNYQHDSQNGQFPRTQQIEF